VQEELVKLYKNQVHYIWVGGGKLPDDFKSNFEKTQELNPSYNFNIWTEEKILPFLEEFEELFSRSSIFHKLQLSRYLILNKEGGICCDFDIEWKKDFDTVYSLFEDYDLVFTRRNSLYSYSSAEKIYLKDDYVIVAKPGFTKSYIEYCLTRTDSKGDESEPFGVRALTEWCLKQKKVGYFDSTQIYDDPNSSIAYHYNKRTWAK
jgi:Glycosyltransferase sugar-binding region containing DXD motif